MLGVNLTGLRAAQIAGKALVLGVSARVFLEKIDSGINGQNGEDLPSTV